MVDPLATVRLTATEMLLQDSHLTAQVRDAATIIQRNVQVEANLIDDLLGLTYFFRAGTSSILRFVTLSCDTRIPTPAPNAPTAAPWVL